MADDYKPMMPERQAQELLALHRRTVAAARRTSDVTITRLGCVFVVPPSVYAPSPLGLAEVVYEEVRQGDHVLDMGTGSGINGIIAATVARHVVAVDLTEDAVECTRQNAIRNNVSEKMDVIQSDIFESVSGRFNLVIFDPPFRWFKPSDSHEVGMTDENYAGLRRFFSQVDDYLAPRGRILMAFSSIGDLEYVKFLIDESRLRSTELRRIDNVTQAAQVSHFAYRLCRTCEV